MYHDSAVPTGREGQGKSRGLVDEGCCLEGWQEGPQADPRPHPPAVVPNCGCVLESPSVYRPQSMGHAITPARLGPMGWGGGKAECSEISQMTKGGQSHELLTQAGSLNTTEGQVQDHDEMGAGNTASWPSPEVPRQWVCGGRLIELFYQETLGEPSSKPALRGRPATSPPSKASWNCRAESALEPAPWMVLSSLASDRRCYRVSSNWPGVWKIE